MGTVLLFLGMNTNLAYKRSRGIGAIARAAIGGRLKDGSTSSREFIDVETERSFPVQVKPLTTNELKTLVQFPVSDINNNE